MRQKSESVTGLLDTGTIGRPPTVAEHVADVLRRAILQGTLKSGVVLRQEDIATQLNVSRMPVREAFRLLQAEGWVVYEPRRGAEVAKVDPADIREVFALRAAVEVGGLRRSIPCLTDIDLARASRLIDELDRASDFDRYCTLHRQFHLTLVSHAGQRFVDQVGQLMDACDRYLRLELVELTNHAESQAEHHQILEACASRDVSRATKLIEPHVAEAGEDLAERIERKRATYP